MSTIAACSSPCSLTPSLAAMIMKARSIDFMYASPHCALLHVGRHHHHHHQRLHSRGQSRSIHGSTHAIADGRATLSSDDSVLLEEQDAQINYAYSTDKVEYNWEEEWYPLYLARELPRDAPLGLTVFHKQLVLHYDGNGTLHCYEDRCPHRLAKLSEGQIIDGRLECLYHGWQFEGDGQCVKIPQLPAGAKIPKAACAHSYFVHDSQGVIWVWMGDKRKADVERIPHFDQFDDPNNNEFSAIHVLPYDHSILLENLMDPAHVPISHDRTDVSAKRENAQALKFEIMERTSRGFAGRWGESTSSDSLSFCSRFEAPCMFWNKKEMVDKDGNKKTSMAIFLCRPAGQGKSMLIVRFGLVSKKGSFSFVPEWLIHQVSNKVFEQDMGFLASQNEVLIREGVPTSRLYLNLRSSDVFVMEYRKWMDKVGHGMPYYVGHKSLSPPPKEAILEAAPAGLVAAAASSQPMKGAFGAPFAADPTNRYFRHVVHCAECRQALQNFKSGQKVSIILAALSAAVGLATSQAQLRTLIVAAAVLAAAGSYFCQLGINMLTTNEVRPHRR